ncbi:alpha/beta hydrolase [Acidobacteriia bacterium AH_259_A11_L15]|nr:alpha/beta hydrolase [Acidobacteriia bacterium AH_259_A11_L15]
MKKKIGGLELAWEEEGQGLPVVLLHAFPLNRKMWEAQRRALSRRYRVITPDFRGHGESNLPEEDSTMERLAEDVRGLLEELKLERVVLGGLSMGGYVAFAFLRRYAARLAGLVLADTRAAPDSEEGRTARYENAALAETAGAGALAERLLPKLLGPSTRQGKPEVVAAVRAMMLSIPPAGMARALRGMAARADSTELLGQVRCPTLVVGGEEDPLSPPAEAEAMAKNIPNAKHVKIPHAGHLSNLEQPAAFNAALEEFLAQFPAR